MTTLTNEEIIWRLTDCKNIIEKERELEPDRRELLMASNMISHVIKELNKRIEEEHETHERSETVSHPFHYNREGGIECLKEIEMFLTAEEYSGFLKGNILKYRYRAADKNGFEDLKKSDFYAKELAKAYGKSE